MATSRNKSYGPPLSSSPSMTRSPPSSSAFASSTASSFTSSPLLRRSTSPTRVNVMYGNINSQSPSLRFSMTDHHRSISPNRSISFKRQTTNNKNAAPVSFKGNNNNNNKRSCACSPTNHRGSYRCAFHKAMMRNGGNSTQTSSYQPSSGRLNFRRSAMTNSLVRIGGVEGELVKRALSALIRPSSHQVRRRTAFESRPSRLSVMSTS